MESGTADVEGNETIVLKSAVDIACITWYTVKISEERVLIFGDDHSQTYSFCPISQVIRDSKGSNCKGNKPCVDFMKEYFRKIENLNIPLFTNDSGRKVLLNFPDTYFDENAYEYKNLITDAVVAGFRKPIL